jgi:hypothetical protein
LAREQYEGKVDKLEVRYATKTNARWLKVREEHDNLVADVQYRLAELSEAVPLSPDALAATAEVERYKREVRRYGKLCVSLDTPEVDGSENLPSLANALQSRLAEFQSERREQILLLAERMQTLTNLINVRRKLFNEWLF